MYAAYVTMPTRSTPMIAKRQRHSTSPMLNPSSVAAVLAAARADVACVTGVR